MKKYLLIFISLFLITQFVYGQNTNVLDLRSVDHTFRVLDNVDDDLDFGGSYTIEFWLFVETHTSTDRVLSRGVSFLEVRLRDISTGTGDYRVRAYNSDASLTSDNLNYNTWYHIAFSRDATEGKLRVYVDGDRQYTTSDTDFNLPSSSNSLYIGSRYSSGAGTRVDFLNGAIDELRISNTQRYTSSNFTINKTDIPFSSDANTVLLFHFDDNTTLPALNSSSNTFTMVNYSVDADDYEPHGDVGGGLPLPVELTKFEAVSKGNNVLLTWETATEVNNYGFNLQRKTNVAEIWEEVVFIEGAGNSNSPKQYSFIDAEKLSGKVSYRLKQVDLDGKFEYSDVITINTKGLSKTELYQNHPNPFNPGTKISFSLSETTEVKLVVYNTLGQEVAELVNKKMSAGVHSVNFDANGITTGFYVYRIETPNYSKTMKMLLLK